MLFDLPFVLPCFLFLTESSFDFLSESWAFLDQPQHWKPKRVPNRKDHYNRSPSESPSCPIQKTISKNYDLFLSTSGGQSCLLSVFVLLFLLLLVSNFKRDVETNLPKPETDLNLRCKTHDRPVPTWQSRILLLDLLPKSRELLVDGKELPRMEVVYPKATGGPQGRTALSNVQFPGTLYAGHWDGTRTANQSAWQHCQTQISVQAELPASPLCY